jgi:2-oxoglutarate dehydrogenase complex dihydrolipoamide succinyltransferase (E2) component
MADTNVIMPQLGESIFEGTITQWLKKEGDRIERDEPLFEISTDKVDSEIPAPQAGTLKQILVGEGETVEINTVVAVISTDGAETGETKSPETPRASAAPSRVETPRPAPKKQTEVPSSPLVRRLAAEHGVDLAGLAGTGAGGRITKRDILSYIEQQGDTTAAASAEDIERVPMTPMRKGIAEHMVASRRTSAHVATVFEVDCSAILKAQAALRPKYEKDDVHLTVSSFFIHAVSRALGKFPILNSSVEADAIILRKSIHVGIAVALDDGLLVPVIRDANRKDLKTLASTMADLASRARSKKLKPEEVQGGTFTVTNPGNFGGLYGIPIINQPQVAILAVGGIGKRPVAIGDAIGIRPMVYLALSFDHRVIDGAVADQFMAEVKRQLEEWAV